MSTRERVEVQIWSKLDDADWNFIHYRFLRFSDDELLRLAAYELSREAIKRGYPAVWNDPAVDLKRLFPSDFPDRAYLALSREVKQKADWTRFPWLFQPYATGMEISYHVVSSEDLEAEAMTAEAPSSIIEQIIDCIQELRRAAKLTDSEAASLIDSCVNLEGLIGPKSSPGNRASGDLRYVRAQLLIDLDYKNEFLCNEFEKFLESARIGSGHWALTKRDPKLRNPRRDAPTLLKKLAVTRLLDFCAGDVANVKAHLEEKSPFKPVQFPYGEDKTWFEARDDIVELCQHGGKLPLEPILEATAEEKQERALRKPPKKKRAVRK